MAAKKTAQKTTESVAKEAAPAAKKAAKKAAPAAKKVAAKKTTAVKAPAKPAPLAKKAAGKVSLDAIARAAYLNYRRRVELGLMGDSNGDWLEAERQLSNPS